MAERSDSASEAVADRVDDAQQIDGERRLPFDAFLDLRCFGVVPNQIDELDQAGL